MRCLTRFGARRKKILVFFYQIQDLDILIPVARALKNSGFDVEPLVHASLAEGSARSRTVLSSALGSWTYSPRSKVALLGKLISAGALFTAADTTARPHSVGHRLTRMANRLAVRTFTLQHGLENIGLTYYDHEYPPETVDFASKTIFIWGKVEDLDERVPDHIRRRCVSVGCPKEPMDLSGDSPPISHRPLVAVFENLHWSRYDTDYRFQFLDDLENTALALPELTILIKPHPAGQWLTKRYEGRKPQAHNLVIADPLAPQWEMVTAASIIRAADAVISTPSTTVFDAARMDKPVAVAAYKLDLPRYSPLPMLKGFSDWTRFLSQARVPGQKAELSERTRNFVSRCNVVGPATDQIAHFLRTKESKESKYGPGKSICRHGH